MKKKKSTFANLSLINNQDGGILVLIALMMVVLLGFAALVTDAGVLYFERRELQNAVDAAALAGAKELPEDASKAISKAEEYALLNGINVTELEEPVVCSDNRTVKVSVNRNVPLYLAKVLKIFESDVFATATARVDPFRGGEGVLPFGIPDTSVNGWDGVLKIPAQDQGDSPEPGWFYYFFGTDANNLSEWVVTGYPEPVEVGRVDPPYKTGQGNMPTVLTELAELIEEEKPDRIEAIVPIITKNTEENYLEKREWEITEFAVIELVEVTELNPQGKATGSSELIAEKIDTKKTVSGIPDKNGDIPESGLWVAWLSK